MGQDTDELKRDIEDTRAGMTDTLDAIGDRVSPGRIAQRQKNRMSASVHSIRERVMGSAEDAQRGIADAAGGAADAIKHTPDAITSGTQGAPLMAGAIAFGAGFLIAAVFSPSEPEKRASAKVMETLEPAKNQLVDSAKEIAERLKEPVKDAAQDLKEAASDSAATVASTARAAADDTKQQTTESVEAIKNGDPTNTLD
jgi:gas vesicle protein